MRTISDNAEADFVIVGSGAAGATAAKVLTGRGMKVVMLDRGPWLTPDHFSGDELKYLNRSYQWQNPRLKPRTFRRNDTETAEIRTFSPVPQGIGGGTTHWGGMVPRMTVSDFQLQSLHGDIPGANLADWPITFAQLEPYYAKVEREFGTSGLAGANHWEGPRSSEYPTPPAAMSGVGKAFQRGLDALGYSSFPIPQAMITEPYRGRKPFSQNGFWQQFPDPGSGKSSTTITFIPQALSTGLLDLRPDSYVQSIETDRRGAAQAVIYLDLQGNLHRVSGRGVIVCAGGIETARLLLLSASSSHPDGLANTSGLVGKNATFHEWLPTVGLFDQNTTEPLNGFAGHAINMCSFDFYETDHDRGHLLGGPLWGTSLGHPINWTFPTHPGWGAEAKKADRDYFNHSMAIAFLLHDLPVESNRIDLDPTVRDAWGLPVARVTHTPHENDFRQAAWQLSTNADIMRAAGATTVFEGKMTAVTGNSSHEMGTARMGIDPATSVVDADGRAHDVPNLWVMDGSVFPTASGVNPTLTIMANAWRCIDALIHNGA